MTHGNRGVMQRAGQSNGSRGAGLIKVWEPEVKVLPGINDGGGGVHGNSSARSSQGKLAKCYGGGKEGEAIKIKQTPIRRVCQRRRGGSQGRGSRAKRRRRKWLKTKEMLWILKDKGETRRCRLKGRCSKKGDCGKKTRRKEKTKTKTRGLEVALGKGRGANTRSCKLGEERENRGGGRAFL